jgi:ribonuclease HII
VTYPSLELEYQLLAQYGQVIGLDEVGRGAIAGPVAVGAALIATDTSTSIPTGLRDSKLIAESKRESVAALVSAWTKTSVGYASVAEIESKGISWSLQQAALRAIKNLGVSSGVILLDGSHNFLQGLVDLPVVVRTKADRDCAVVSAAALSAKVARDQTMIELHDEYPAFEWSGNKGYASERHIAALRELGPSQHHRVSWLGKILDEGLF